MTPRATLVLVLVLAIAALGACASSNPPRAATGLQPRTSEIGSLEVKVTPTQLDNRGAAFEVVFDTHTDAPGIDVAANAALVVDGAAWSAPSWTGDEPGGHHRRGTLRFTSAGPARGDAQLIISGLDEPLQLTWRLTN
jgi:hypothetical protein